MDDGGEPISDYDVIINERSTEVEVLRFRVFTTFLLIRNMQLMPNTTYL